MTNTFINSFPGYEKQYDEKHHVVNMFRGEDVGLGGYVYGKPGIYIGRIKVYDVSGMHPASIRALNLFGDEYTKRFGEIVDLRLAIKHKDFESARKMLNGQISKYLEDESIAKQLSNALKIVVNSCYGQTCANYINPMRDPRNDNNIVALRGALFMKTLLDEVTSMGYEVISIKTDSIKVVNPDEKLDKFIFDFGKKYGYNFEIENIFERICLVNDSTFIAKCANDDPETPGKWIAKAKQFQVPYVFKTLFSHEPIEFNDMCETKSVSTTLYLDMNETLPNVAAAEKDLGKYEDMLELGKISQDEFDKVSYMLKEEIAQGHDYRFIGKVGQFCPILPGFGGGLLRHEKDGKYYAVTGTKKKDGTLYRWLESEMVRTLEKEDCIDESYYQNLCNEAVKAIDKAGEPFGITYDMFIDDNYIPLPSSVTKVATDEEVPFH